MGKVDYNRERRFYEIICDLLLGDLPGGQPGLFELGSAWTFNRRGTGAAGEDAMIDEYVVDYEEYPGYRQSGGITYLGENLYVNTFSVREYNTAIEAGHMSMMGKTTFSLRDRMRYRFMMQLFGLRLDKRQFERDFGMSVERGLPVEMGFMRACRGFRHRQRRRADADAEGPLPGGGHDAPVLHRREQLARSGSRGAHWRGARASSSATERLRRNCGATKPASADAVAAEIAREEAASAILDGTQAVASEE